MFLLNSVFIGWAGRVRVGLGVGWDLCDGKNVGECCEMLKNVVEC